MQGKFIICLQLLTFFFFPRLLKRLYLKEEREDRNQISTEKTAK